MWNDLWLNLISEGLGIIVTIFIVDRLLKRNDQKRWKPTKNLIYSRLTKVTWFVFLNFSPSSLHEEITAVDLSFGTFTTGIVKDFSALDLDFSALEPLLTEELADNSIGSWLDMHYKLLSEADHTLNGIVNDAGAFLEPEILSLVFQLKEANNRFLYFVSNMRQQTDVGDETRLSNWAGFFATRHLIHKLLFSAQTLERFLVTQSTRRQTVDEIFIASMENIDDAKNIPDEQGEGKRWHQRMK